MAAISIGRSDRVIAFGATESGKSFLMRHLLRDEPRLIALDTKGEMGRGSGWRLSDDWNKAYERLRRGQPARVRLPQVRIRGQYETYFEKIYALKNVRVYIDELPSVGPPTGSPGLLALYQRGRSRGISVFAAAQRPLWIPRSVLTETTWIFMFYLQMADDREYMIRQVLGPGADRILPDRQFLAWRRGWREPSGPYQLTERGGKQRA